MGDEDGWGNIVDLLQQKEKKVRVKKRKEIAGDTLPSWMKKCVYSSGDDGYEAAEYLIEYFTASAQKRRHLVQQEASAVPSSVDIQTNENHLLDIRKDLEPNITLNMELLAKLRKDLEELQNTPPPHTPPPQFEYLRETPMLAEALTELSLHTLRDEALAEISRHFISLEGSSYVQCLRFAKHTLLPKVKGLSTTASRALVGGLIHCAKLHPAPLMHGLLIPLVTDDTGSVQSEVVNRIAFVEKSLSPELCQEFMREIVSKKQVWTDPFVVLVTNALNLNIQLTDEIGSLIVTQASKQVDAFASSPKFAKLILILITKYPTLSKPHTAALQQILSKCQNFMAKSALTQLEKL